MPFFGGGGASVDLTKYVEIPYATTQTTRGAANQARYLFPPFMDNDFGGTTGGNGYEFCGNYLYVPRTGSYFFSTSPAALYTTNTKTCWGLYKIHTDGLPSTLVYSLGELDVGGGANSLSESAASTSLAQGWYAVVYRMNGNFNLWSPRTKWLFTAMVGSDSNKGTTQRRFYRALAYSTSLDSDLTTTTWTEDGNYSATLSLRRG